MNITERQSRLYHNLYQDLGEIINYLADKDVNEILLNPDGKIWLDKTSTGLINVGYIEPHQGLSIIQDVSGILGQIVRSDSPYIEAYLPNYKELQGQRFTGLIPPIVPFPAFSIRKRAEAIFTLEDYLASKRMTFLQADVLRKLVTDQANILVCGGPGSGKTTVTNALIVEAVKADPHQRFVLLEDQPELQCSAKNTLSLRTSSNASMQDLLKRAMRMLPHRILVGEVRGGEALDMLKAWNTGCPGGICTVHANGCEEAIQRILDLAMEAGLISPPVSLVKHTINAVVSVIRNQHQKGFINEVLSLRGYQNGKFEFEKLA